MRKVAQPHDFPGKHLCVKTCVTHLACSMRVSRNHADSTARRQIIVIESQCHFVSLCVLSRQPAYINEYTQ
jgi:hypothetical protein